MQYLSLWNFTSAHLHKSHLSSSHTFESETHSTLSTIDHIMCHHSLLPRIQFANTLSDHPLNTSDHLPVVASIHLHQSQSAPPDMQDHPTPVFIPRNWSRIPKTTIYSLYTQPLHKPLLNLLQSLPPESTLSLQPSLIDHYLSALTALLLTTSKNVPPKTFQQSKRPGWGPGLKSAKRNSKHFHRLWVSAGRPHDKFHPARVAYKGAKRKYRKQIRLHKKLSDEIFYKSLDLETNPRRFFQAIRNRSTPSYPHPPTNRILVNGATFEGTNILEGWAQYFEMLSASSVPPATDLACRQEILRLFQSQPS